MTAHLDRRFGRLASLSPLVVAGILLVASPARAQSTARDVEAGPLWNQREAEARCPRVCVPPSRWNGRWRTTVAGRMSVCSCESPVVVVPPPPPPPVQVPALPPPPPPSPPVAMGSCQWVDGSDPAAPPADAGRGISDWAAHYHYAADPSRSQAAAELVAGRVSTLRGCMSSEQYARLYADVSVRIAYVGRTFAGWSDAGGPDTPANDGGRALLDWRAHREYASSGPGAFAVPNLVMHRLRHLHRRLPPDAYARLYADLSILIATYTRMN